MWRCWPSMKVEWFRTPPLPPLPAAPFLFLPALKTDVMAPRSTEAILQPWGEKDDDKSQHTKNDGVKWRQESGCLVFSLGCSVIPRHPYLFKPLFLATNKHPLDYWNDLFSCSPEASTMGRWIRHRVRGHQAEERNSAGASFFLWQTVATVGMPCLWHVLDPS